MILDSRTTQVHLAVLLVVAVLLQSAWGAKTKAVNPKNTRAVALVVGNSAYQFAENLPNPRNDAEDIVRTLDKLGFEVIGGTDLTATQFRDALRKFRAAGAGEGVGLFFYAGHGIQVSGQNYLVPVDARLDESLLASLETLQQSTIMMRDVLEVLDAGYTTSLIFLDACRNNPLVADITTADGPQGRAIRIQKTEKTSEPDSDSDETLYLRQGLAEVEASSSRNTFIAYATQPGNVALDGTGDNSPFTEALLANLRSPGLEVRELMTRVRRQVMENSANQQVPWDHASLTQLFYFLAPATQNPPPP